MGWEDRDYNRSRSGGINGPLQWMMHGQVPLFRAFGISVRAHASLIIFIGFVLIFGLGEGSSLADRAESMSALFAIVLLHEFGHCFAARWVGGEANDIVMHPLGGLAFARAPHRPLAQFITVAGGPAVNVVICLICGIALYSISHWLPWDPTFAVPAIIRENEAFERWAFWVRWLVWIYQMSYVLLIFNLLPIFPLDGGQMLQAILWPKFGYYKSMLFSCVTGMVGAVLAGLYSLTRRDTFLLCLAVMGFMTCMQLRRQLLANGPMVEDTTDYSAAYEQPTRRKPPSRRAQKKIEKLDRIEKDEREEIDTILAKVSATGMQSLTSGEKRALRRATESQRKRDAQRSDARRRSLGA